MSEVVVDASILSALFLNEEGSEYIRKVVESEITLFAPSFWRFEVSNAIWKRKVIPPETAKHLIDIIWDFPVYTDEPKELAIDSLFVARKYGITFYGSFYIAMAKFIGIPLWTMDKIQAKSAIKAGVSLRK